MNCEEFLLNLIKSVVIDIEKKLTELSMLPESVTIPGLDDGKIIGYARSLELIGVALHLYERKKDEKKKKARKKP